MKCSQCGLESAVEQAFTRAGGLLGKRQYCPSCTLNRQRNEALVYFVALPVGAALLWWLARDWFVTPLVVGVSVILLINLPLIVLHELAHAAVARLVGFRVFAVNVGVGRPFFTREWGGVNWVFGPFPLGGLTFVGSPPGRGYRLRLWLITLAGPLLHFIFLFGSYHWLVNESWRAWFDPMTYQLMLYFCLANLVVLLANIFPRKINTPSGVTGTDGWHLLCLPFLKNDALQIKYAGYYMSAAMHAYQKNALDAARAMIARGLELLPNYAAALNILGVIQVQQQDYAGAKQLFLGLLTRTDLDVSLKYAAINNVAYCNVLLEDPALLPEADTFSQDAMRHLPWHPAIVGTRGLVLAHLGQVEEGLAMLKRAMDEHHDAHSKALSACHIAQIEDRRGNPNVARQFLDAARALDPGCILLPATLTALSRPGESAQPNVE